MDGSGLFHRELIAVQVLVQGAADIVLAAVEDSLQNAGMGPADGFVLVGLQAELAQPLDVLEGGLQGRGYTSIALISGPLNSAGGRLRREGFEAEMGELLDPTLLLESPYDLEGGHRAMVELLGREERPQAVFAASDVIARGALRAINESGLRIPDDIALASFDDADPATGVRMKLTTMRQPLRTISEAAVNLLVDQIDGEDADSRVLDTELVIGEST